MRISLFGLLLVICPPERVAAFTQIRPTRIGGSTVQSASRKYNSSTEGGDGTPATTEADAALQWELFNKHHAGRSWRGTWTTLDYMGDVMDETLASIELKKDGDAVKQEHEMVVGGKVADCETCFDSFETQTLPVATYSKGQLYKQRLAAVSLVNGPRVLRSGAMTTELVLKHGDGRVRVIFYHAPAWKNKEDEYQTPPDGLKFYRATVSREADRDEVPNRLQEQFPNTPEKGNPKFFRPVPPFAWHKKWGGTSWTWGPQSGDKGWMVEDMEEGDAWHGRPRGDSSNVWSMRLPGGILIQCPRVIPPNDVELCRLAWLPEDDTLLRAEASISCLKPIVNSDDEMVGLAPPELVALRCDMMEMRGEVDEASTMYERIKRLSETDEDETVLPEK